MDRLTYLLALVRHEIERSFGCHRPFVRLDPGNWRPGFVNVTLRRNGQVCGSMGAQGGTLRDAAIVASRRALADNRFRKLTVAGDLAATVVEVWVERTRERLYGPPETIEKQLTLGYDGVRVSFAGNSAYYKPSVAITSAITSPGRLLEKLSRKAGLHGSAWRSRAASIERTTWDHVIETGEFGRSAVALRGLRSSDRRDPTVAQLERATRNCVARMLNVQKADGSFGYEYDPFENVWDDRWHSVRLAGCAYALSRASKHAALRTESRRDGSCANVLRFLAGRLAPARSGNGSVVAEGTRGSLRAKLGATALFALACEYQSDDRWLLLASELAEPLLAAQNENGSFDCDLLGDDERAASQDFYPGETLLALFCYWQRTRDERAYRAIARSFGYYAAHFRRRPATAFVLWQTDVWTRVVEAMEMGALPAFGSRGPTRGEISSFVFDQIDWLLRFQYTNDDACPSDVVGGFKKPRPPAISSATYGEAVTRACSVARLAGDGERYARYKQAARACLAFVLRLQVSEGTDGLFPRPELAIGGATKSLASFEMRCDYDQHFITMCLTAIDESSLWT